jgi:hypothetical protein
MELACGACVANNFVCWRASMRRRSLNSKRSRMERSDPNFTIPYDAPSAYELRGHTTIHCSLRHSLTTKASGRTKFCEGQRPKTLSGGVEVTLD